MNISFCIAACASGSVAALSAIADLRSGAYRTALVVGVELEKTVPGDAATSILGTAAWTGHEGESAKFMWPHMFDAVAAEYPEVTVDYNHIDATTIYMVTDPSRFDVIVTDNLFGDILSDAAAMLTGSLGMLPSASLGAPDAKIGSRKALYEPVHGSAPDIAGKGIANPIAMIASFALPT